MNVGVVGLQEVRILVSLYEIKIFNDCLLPYSVRCDFVCLGAIFIYSHYRLTLVVPLIRDGNGDLCECDNAKKTLYRNDGGTYDPLGVHIVRLAKLSLIYDFFKISHCRMIQQQMTHHELESGLISQSNKFF